MFDTDLMEYRIDEDRFEDLCNARHLVNLLSELSTAGISEHTVTLNRESLASTFDLIGGMMDSALPDLCPNPKPKSNQAITSENAQGDSSAANGEQATNNSSEVKS